MWDQTTPCLYTVLLYFCGKNLLYWTKILLSFNNNWQTCVSYRIREATCSTIRNLEHPLLLHPDLLMQLIMSKLNIILDLLRQTKHHKNSFHQTPACSFYAVGELNQQGWSPHAASHQTGRTSSCRTMFRTGTAVFHFVRSFYKKSCWATPNSTRWHFQS